MRYGRDVPPTCTILGRAALVASQLRKAERMDHAVSDGKISDGVAFYDSIAFDELWHGVSPRAPERSEADSRPDTGHRGAG
ncbi:hypothetical protein [Microbacterium immunditiarum]|uniref:Uncharacterized protein n=1 Tax=Microbacterium immunditiarum TaxID=337480 RepID=A0A7Y9KM26_9MICO|nr:hypothetical protein [Microbacterium immunditiarum]NYE20858.1 hypothetical protein [Microbacterium immunditiarum]